MPAWLIILRGEEGGAGAQTQIPSPQRKSDIFIPAKTVTDNDSPYGALLKNSDLSFKYVAVISIYY